MGSVYSGSYLAHSPYCSLLLYIEGKTRVVTSRLSAWLKASVTPAQVTAAQRLDVRDGIVDLQLHVAVLSCRQA